jgi:nitrate/TMAO reductase-like tetraheme cytochrome c subunit
MNNLKKASVSLLVFFVVAVIVLFYFNKDINNKVENKIQETVEEDSFNSKHTSKKLFEESKSYILKISYQDYVDDKAVTKTCDCQMVLSSSTQYVTKVGTYTYITYTVTDTHDNQRSSNKGILYLGDDIIERPDSNSPQDIYNNTFENIKFSTSGRYVYFENRGFEDGSFNIFDTQGGIKNITDDFKFPESPNYVGPISFDISPDESSFAFVSDPLGDSGQVDVHVKNIKGDRILKSIKLAGAREYIDNFNTKLLYKNNSTLELVLWEYKNDSKEPILKDKLEIKLN